MKKFLVIVGSLIAILIPAIFMTLDIMRTASIECEVCMEFRGRQKCRKASGPDQDSCRRTAADNACAFIASGMADSIACTQAEPIRVEYGGS